MIEHAAGEAPRGLRRSSAASIVAGYLGNHTVAPAEIPTIIASVHAALSAVGTPIEPTVPKRVPAVAIRKSVTPEAIICLDCGFSGQMIRRHLTTAPGLSVKQYRERWGLGPDYPVVAPNYAAKRSMLAKEIGLGTQTRRRGRRTR